MTPLRIAVVGAECTGKTRLCAALAQATGGRWVPEYLREFVDVHGRPPRADEQAALADEQRRREDAACAAAVAAGEPLVAFDSAPLATALYSRFYFGDDRLLAEAAAQHRQRYELTLLADVDLPWEADGRQRDGPVLRARFHALLLDWLGAQHIPFAWVRGRAGERLAAALVALPASLRAPAGR